MKKTTTSRPSTVSITIGERARVPFAIIGVLLLLTSVMSVAVFQSRVDPEPSVDASLAMDRTSANTQTVVANAVTDATDRAAREPLMVPDESSAWGRAIANTGSDGEPDWTDGLLEEYDDEVYDVNPDMAFERYLKLRIYSTVERDLRHLDGEFRDDTTTNVTIPPLENDTASADDAIDRVEIDAGTSPGNGLDPGQLEVTIEDVETTVEQDGRVVADRVEDVTVTVETNVFVLHQKTREYEQQLNKSILDGEIDDPTSLDGFGQHFAARIYPLTWARGAAQWGGAPISEVVANRHSEVLANNAVFTVQESVFGTTDPNEQSVMRNAWGCLAAQDAEELYEGQTGDEPPVADAEDFCDGLEYLYGDQNANLDEPIDTMDVMGSTADSVGETAGMGNERTISVDEFADLAYAETLAEMDFDDVIDDVHEVDVDAELETVADRTNTPSGDQPSGLTDSSNWSKTRDDLSTDATVTATLEDDGPDTAQEETDYYTVVVSVHQDHERELRWSYSGPEDVSSPVTRTRHASSEFETEIEVSATHPNRDAIEYRGIDGGYNASVLDEWPDSLPDAFFEDDDGWEADLVDDVTLDTYAGLPDESADELLEVNPSGDIEAGLESQVTNADELDSEDELRDRLAVADGDSATLDTDPQNDLITATIALDLYYIRAQLQEQADDVTFDDGELLTDDPFGELNEEIDGQLVYHGVGDRYPTVADQARVEARQEYVDNVKDQIELTSNATQKVQDELSDRLDDQLDASDNVLEDLTDFSREVAGGGADYQEAELESPYSDEIEFTPSGSPTYLSLENVTAEEVPATENATHTPMAARNNNWFAVPYSEVDLGVVADILNWLLGGDDDDALTLRMAGELLESARLADLLLEDEGGELIDDEMIYADLENAVTNEINDLSGATTAELDGLEHGLELDDHRIEELVGDGIDDIGDGTPGQQAAMLGSGEGIDYVEQHVRKELDVDNHGDNPYADDEIFKQHAGASVNYALTEAVNQTAVDGFDSDHVDYLNESVRDELEERTEEVIDQRVNETINESDLENEWLQNNETGLLDEDGEFDLSPNRVPAGLPIVPLPKGWVATTNIWDVEVKGEYARFELESNTGTPSNVHGENYVREEGTVTLDGQRVGSTRPISFESQTIVIVVVPPYRLGVGDRTGDWAEESEGWPDAGPRT
ncbi:hypothetical protein ACLI4Z_08260 [Natrialbaceae archaeon A-arb3/5]